MFPGLKRQIGEFMPWLELVLGGAWVVCVCGSREPIHNTCRLGIWGGTYCIAKGT